MGTPEDGQESLENRLDREIANRKMRRYIDSLIQTLRSCHLASPSGSQQGALHLLVGSLELAAQREGVCLSGASLA